MKVERLPKGSETKKQEGCRKRGLRRGRPQLIWEDCEKRDLRKAEEEEKWRETFQQQGAMEKKYEVSRKPGPV